MKKPVKFAILTDVHLGKNDSFNKGRTLGAKAPALLRQFVQQMNQRFKPNFVISLGDVIRDESHTQDKKLMHQYRRSLSNLKMPVYFVIGNHDIRNLTDKEIKKTLGFKRFYYTFDAGSVRFIALYSFARRKKARHNPVLILNRQLRWLKSTLKKSKKPVVIFNHYPLDEQDLRTNPYAEFFLRFPWRAAINNRAVVRTILEASKNVLAVFTGHLHWKKKNVIRNIPYYSVPSLTEVKHGAWEEVTVRSKDVSVRMHSVRI